MKIMKAKEKIRKIAGNRWARTAALALTAAIAFSWLYVALAIILCILNFLVF